MGEIISEKTGWFIIYRGNGYGPFKDYKTALIEFEIRQRKEPTKIVRPVYGTARVENRKLINFMRIF